MEYNFKNCIYPEGALWITFDSYSQSIELKRCLWHNPFCKLSINDYKKIDDIIDYSLNFNYPKMMASENERDKCSQVCKLPNTIKNVSVSISHACNLRCYHCYFDGDHKDSPVQKDAYFDTLEKIKGHNLEKILLTDNGEPFYYYHRIKNYLSTLSLNDTKIVEITTNLTLLSKERIKELYDIMKTTNIDYKFIISIDGISKETFESTRIGASWEKAIKNTKELIRYFGTDNIIISYVIRKPAIKDAPYAKNFFLQNFGLRADIYYDFYDEECKKVFYSLD